MFQKKKAPVNEKAQRYCLLKFAEMCPTIRPSKCRKYATSVLPVIEEILKNGNEMMQQTFSDSMDRILDILVYYLKEVEIQKLIDESITNLSHTVAGHRRSATELICSICRHYPKSQFSYIVGALKIKEICLNQVGQNTQGIVGISYCLTKLVRLSDTFSKRKLDPRNPMLEHIPLIVDFLIKFLDNEDHNVVSGCSELLIALVSCFGEFENHRAWFRNRQEKQEESEKQEDIKYMSPLSQKIEPDELLGKKLDFVQRIIPPLESLLTKTSTRTGTKASVIFGVSLVCRNFSSDFIEFLSNGSKGEQSSLFFCKF